MTKEDFYVIGAILLIFFGFCFGIFKVGRYLERQVLTEEFKQQFEIAYFEGHEDGRKKGYSGGYRDGLAACDKEEFFSGRY